MRPARTEAGKVKNPMRTAFARFMLVVAVLFLWIGAIGVRLVHLQVNRHDWLRQRALEQRRFQKRSKLLRGSIYDRSGRTLAMSINVHSLYADPLTIGDIEAASGKIAAVLGKSRSVIARKLRSGRERNRRFVWIARKLDEEKYARVNRELADEGIRKFDLPRSRGLHWTTEQKRTYPYKSLAAHVIGFANSDDIGQAGIELSMEKELRGNVRRLWKERDRLGRVYEESGTEPERPKDLVLTLSSSIQFKVEEALAKGVRQANAKSGKAIVLDPKTGEVLAIANYPSFDPNRFSKTPPAAWRNRVVQDNYTPGSVFKMVTYGAALEEGLIRPDDMIDCGTGKITVAGHTFNDTHSVGNVSYTRALAESSNVGAVKTGLKIGKKSFYAYARKFGFGSPTGIELPAEAPGLLRPPDKWFGDSLASLSIGYEIGVTALQTAVAFATIANDGVKVRPHLIKEIRQPGGKALSAYSPGSERVVSGKTAAVLRRMLKSVVTEGTAKEARLRGYTSAGKTGTAWKYDPSLKRVSSEKYVSSFVGFAPADDPRVVIAIVVDEPRGPSRYGGQVAAPVFREIAEQILPELNVTPDDSLFDPESDPGSPQIPEPPSKGGNGTPSPAVLAGKDALKKKRTGNGSPIAPPPPSVDGPAEETGNHPSGRKRIADSPRRSEKKPNHET